MKLKFAFLILVFAGLFYSALYCQNNESFHVGISYGTGSSEWNMMDIDNYFYDYDSYKIVLNFTLVGKRIWSLEGVLEPTYFQAIFKDFEISSIEDPFRTLKEYGLNIGIVSRLMISQVISTYFLGSTGPLYINSHTSRMKNGIGFSNNFCLGFTVQVKKMRFDIRTGIRHVSNAGLNSPNRGYNSSITEMGISFPILRKKPSIPRSDWTNLALGY